jgi:hypothetical protein
MNSLELAKRNSERKEVLERRMHAFMQRYDDPQFKENKPLAEVKVAAEKPSSVQRDLEALRAELDHEREWRTRFLESEKALKQKVEEQEHRIAQLEAQLSEQNELVSRHAKEKEHLIQLNQSLTATLEQAQGEMQSSGNYLSTLHKELSLQRRAQEAVLPTVSEEANESFSLAMRIRSQRIEELEELFRATSGKYEEMKKQVTAPKKFHRKKEELTEPTPATHSANQSFRSYSIRVDSAKRSHK